MPKTNLLSSAVMASYNGRILLRILLAEFPISRRLYEHPDIRYRCTACLFCSKCSNKGIASSFRTRASCKFWGANFFKINELFRSPQYMVAACVCRFCVATISAFLRELGDALWLCRCTCWRRLCAQLLLLASAYFAAMAMSATWITCCKYDSFVVVFPMMLRNDVWAHLEQHFLRFVGSLLLQKHVACLSQKDCRPECVMLPCRGAFVPP